MYAVKLSFEVFDALDASDRASLLILCSSLMLQKG